MVAGNLSISELVTGYSAAGYPPILQLSGDLKTLTGPEKLLATQISTKAILDTRKLSEPERREFAEILTKVFGSPEKPKVEIADAIAKMEKWITEKEPKAMTDDARNEIATLRDDLEMVRSMESELHLDEKTLAHGGKLYRNYCQQCHGLTGDGNGPGGRFLIPVPRDYRQGLFKFISTDPTKVSSRKPRRADLERTIVKGLDGAPMPSFVGLTPTEVEAVISYVTHLSIRGESEYRTMRMVLNDTGNFNDTISGEVVTQFTNTCRNWIKSEKNPIIPDPDPYTTDEKKLEAAANGYTLFTADAKAGGAGCGACHFQLGRQDNFKFDDWGNVVRARNLTLPILRGGRKPDDIYYRIYGGIPGSNMPAHNQFRPGLLERAEHVDKIWQLVQCVLTVSESEGRQKLKEKYQIDLDQ